MSGLLTDRHTIRIPDSSGRNNSQKSELFCWAMKDSVASRGIPGISGAGAAFMDKNCPVCFGIGWVCENHPDRAWSDELGCMCGAGMPCECNRADEPDITQVIIEEGSRS
jgi:hypothetical protein